MSEYGSVEVNRHLEDVAGSPGTSLAVPVRQYKGSQFKLDF